MLRYQSSLVSYLFSSLLFVQMACAPEVSKSTVFQSSTNVQADEGTFEGAREVKAEEDLALFKALEQEGSLRVLVSFQDVSAVSTAKAAWKYVAQSAGLDLSRAFDRLPILQLDIHNARELATLLSLKGLARITPDSSLQRFLSQSLPLIRQPETISQGYDGSGTAVAVLDTGIDFSREAFGSCLAVGAAGCRVVFAKDFASEDNQADDSDHHGTNVAAVVAAVAPGTQLLALDVFDGQYAKISDILAAIDWVIAHKDVYHIASMNLSLGGGRSSGPCADDPLSVGIQAARDAGVLAAVAAGNDGFRSALSSPACSPAAVSVGAVYDRSYGTNVWGNCIDWTSGPDKPACFSNSSSQLTLLAPGINITAGGVTMSGTSQATPFVAAAMAVLRSNFPSISPTSLVDRMVSTGKSVLDSRNGIRKPRLDLYAASQKNCSLAVSPGLITVGASGAFQSLSVQTGVDCRWRLAELPAWISAQSATSGIGNATLELSVAPLNVGERKTDLSFTGDAKALVSVTQKADVSGLDATMLLNQGALWTQDSLIHVSISLQNPSYPTAMCLSEGDHCEMFEAPSAERNWTLSSGDGLKTVKLWLRDAYGNEKLAAQAQITLDTTAPLVQVFLLNNGAVLSANPDVRIHIEASDASGVEAMCLSTESSCQNWQPFQKDVIQSFVGFEGELNLHLWLRDRLGHESAMSTATVFLDTVAPQQAGFQGLGLPASMGLSWSEATDKGSGIANYILVFSKGSLQPANQCQSGSRLNISGTSPILVTGLSRNSLYTFRLCAQDKAGNVSPGLLWSGRTL